MTTNFEKLAPTQHMLAWLSDNPFEEIISTLTKKFVQQSASTKMLDFEITDEPEWLTGGKKSAEDEMIVVRTGFAVPCSCTLQDDNGTYHLNGIFTWVGVNLDTKPRTKMWMDLDGTIEEFGKEGLLMKRIYYDPTAPN